MVIQLFVSHASEDKTEFVRPLAHALKGFGLEVWYDEFSLKPGDSLRRSIDRGLAECTAGVVVLSPAFFAKEWPQRELDALFAAELAGRSRIVPIWFQIDFPTIAAVSPLLADRLAIRADLGTRNVAAKIAELFDLPGRYSGSQLAEAIEKNIQHDLYAGETLNAGCQYRFLKLNAFKEACCILLENRTSTFTDEQIENFPVELAHELDEEEERLRQKLGIPIEVYLTTDEPAREQHLGSYREAICEWSSGTLAREESAELISDLDLGELDEYFILLDIPNFSISGRQRPILEEVLVELGCGYDNDFTRVQELCDQLRRLDDDA